MKKKDKNKIEFPSQEEFIQHQNEVKKIVNKMVEDVRRRTRMFSYMNFILCLILLVLSTLSIGRFYYLGVEANTGNIFILAMQGLFWLYATWNILLFILELAKDD